MAVSSKAHSISLICSMGRLPNSPNTLGHSSYPANPRSPSLTVSRGSTRLRHAISWPRSARTCSVLAPIRAWHPGQGSLPGNNESAGKRRRGKSRRGNRYLRRVLVQSAWAARKTPTFLGRTVRRFEVRLGGKKAAVAVAPKILAIVYHLLAEGTFEEERYDRLQPKQEEQQRKQAITMLEGLGYQVTVAPVA